MFKYYFEQIENISTGPVISLIIFFVFFLLMIIYLIRMDKKYVDKMKNLPMDNEEQNFENNFSHEKI